MDSVFHFIITNYQLFVVAFSFIIFVLSITLRKNKNTLIDSSASYKLVSLIIEAESKYGSGNGEQKLLYVITEYCKSIGIPVNSDTWSMVKVLVEKILSTPQKKN